MSSPPPPPGEFTCTASENFDCDLRMRTDYPVLLNNLLQGHRTGNLTSHFQYVMTREGPDDNVTHIATAKCEYSAIERNV